MWSGPALCSKQGQTLKLDQVFNAEAHVSILFFCHCVGGKYILSAFKCQKERQSLTKPLFFHFQSYLWVLYLNILNIFLNRTHCKQFLLYCDLAIKQHYYDLTQDTTYLEEIKNVYNASYLSSLLVCSVLLKAVDTVLLHRLLWKIPRHVKDLFKRCTYLAGDHFLRVELMFLVDEESVA